MSRQTLHAINAAHRVLAAIAVECEPDFADLVALRTLAPPLAHLPAEALATEVIHLAHAIANWQPHPSDTVLSTVQFRHDAESKELVV